MPDPIRTQSEADARAAEIALSEIYEQLIRDMAALFEIAAATREFAGSLTDIAGDMEYSRHELEVALHEWDEDQAYGGERARERERLLTQRRAS